MIPEVVSGQSALTPGPSPISHPGPRRERGEKRRKPSFFLSPLSRGWAGGAGRGAGGEGAFRPPQPTWREHADGRREFPRSPRLPGSFREEQLVASPGDVSRPGLLVFHFRQAPHARG